MQKTEDDTTFYDKEEPVSTSHRSDMSPEAEYSLNEKDLEGFPDIEAIQDAEAEQQLDIGDLHNNAFDGKTFSFFPCLEL